jgi:hypothetical protein
MKVVNQVNQTNDYTKFKTLKGNRNVNKLHIKRLQKSFKQSYLLSPIIINQNYEIIDGQHRFEAAKAENLPINFILCNDYGLTEVQLLNTNMKNWKKEDYLNAYCDLGYKNYLIFRNFMRKYPDFGIAACEVLLTGTLNPGHKSTSKKEFRSETNKSGSYAIRYFQEGDLEIPDYEQSVDSAERILMIKPYYDGFARPTFVRAICGVFRVSEYEHAKLIDRLKSNPNSIEHCSNVTQYKLLIEDVYNFRSRNKVSLRF